jgi:hypothetical protein
MAKLPALETPELVRTFVRKMTMFKTLVTLLLKKSLLKNWAFSPTVARLMTMSTYHKHRRRLNDYVLIIIHLRCYDGLRSRLIFRKQLREFFLIISGYC